MDFSANFLPLRTTLHWVKKKTRKIMFAFKCCVLAPLQPVEFELCKWRFDEISHIVNNPKPGIMCLRNGPGVRQISIPIMPPPLSSSKGLPVS